MGCSLADSPGVRLPDWCTDADIAPPWITGRFIPILTWEQQADEAWEKFGNARKETLLRRVENRWRNKHAAR